MKRIVLLLSVIVFLASCSSYKKVVYVQEAGQNVNFASSVQDTLPAPVIKNGDLLMITVSTISSEAAAPFNIQSGATSESGSGTGISYLVNGLGEINFPVLGKIKVSGLTVAEFESKLRSLIYPKYTNEDPIVTVRLAGFKVSILGDVNSPSVVKATGEQLSIFEALAQAGDLAMTGRRDNVLLIRQDNQGKRETFRINLTDKNLIQSPYYFLQSNDVIYVQPNNSKLNAQTLSFTKVFGTVASIASVSYILLQIFR